MKLHKYIFKSKHSKIQLIMFNINLNYNTKFIIQFALTHILLKYIISAISALLSVS